MKKLKKLTLKETGKQIPLISTKEAEKLLGGTGNANDANTVQMDSSEITILNNPGNRPMLWTEDYVPLGDISSGSSPSGIPVSPSNVRQLENPANHPMLWTDGYVPSGEITSPSGSIISPSYIIV